MKSIESKKARLVALYNAEEFIRSHGEEGGIDEDTFDLFTAEVYHREKLAVAKMIKKIADDYRRKYDI